MSPPANEVTRCDWIDFASVLRPIAHGEDLPIPVPLELCSLDTDGDHDDDHNSTGSEPSTSTDPDYELPYSTLKSNLISQSELTDLVRDMELPMSKADCNNELLRK